MEDLTGLIIYIVIAIIGVLASVYRSKNKKKSVIPPPFKSAPVEAEPAETSEDEFDPFAGLFDEKSGWDGSEAEEDVKEKEFATRKDITAEETYAGKDIKEEESKVKEFNEGEAVFKETDEALISDNDSDITAGQITDEEYVEGIFAIGEEEPLKTEHEKYSEKEEKFDLRQAVIYSEILKRREY